MAYTTINKSTDYFNTVTFTGNGSLPRAITGVGHQPDFVWLKDRDTSYNHQLYDSVRGTSAGVLYSNTNAVEDSSYQMSSFNSDGFTLGSNLGAVNENNKKIVGWNWKANGAGSANSDGTISSTVSANTTAGFSIVSYTGNDTDNAKVGHGLGVAPSVMIFKSRSLANRNWSTYHKDVPITKVMFLNTSASATTTSSRFNDTAPTSSLINLGTNGDVNDSGVTYIAYCFAEKTGYSKFGSYTGNGNADGPFIYTGFKPAWLMVKNTATTSSWEVWDAKRNTFNPTAKSIFPDGAGAEYDYTNRVDLLSNGFKLRTTSSPNGSGNTHIYMAFAEAPLVGSNNVPCTAR